MNVSDVLNYTHRQITIRGNVEYSNELNISDIDITYHDADAPLSNEQFHALAAQVSASKAILEMENTIKSHLNAVAVGRDYDSQLSIASYTGSKNASWKAEADAFVVWRDDVWVYAFQVLAEVEAGTREAPTPEQLIAELPVITWPE